MSDDWRSRLLQAVERDGRSRQEIARASGLSRTYFRAILKLGRDPSIANLAAIAKTLNVSLSWLVDGIELSPESERLLKVWASFPKDERELLLELFVRQSDKRK